MGKRAMDIIKVVAGVVLIVIAIIVFIDSNPVIQNYIRQREYVKKIAVKEAKLKKAVERDSIFKRIGLIDNERLIEKLSAATQNLQELDYQIEENTAVLEKTANTVTSVQNTLADVRGLIKKNKEAIR